MLVPENEGKACNAVVRWLEERTGNTRTDVCLPEKCRIGPPVEMRLFLGDQEYALEHTNIEPFTESIWTGISLEKFFAPIKDAVSGQLPGPALYQLTFPYNPRIEEKDSEIEQRQNVVIHQIFHYARDLYDEASTSLELCERVCSVRPLNGLPYPLELSCLILPNLTDVKVGAARRVPNDLEKKRELRLLDALNKKCGKLNDCNGTRTVLVLENNDIALTSEVAVREILRRIFADDEYEINEIFLVNTTTTESWYLRPLKCGLDWPQIDPAMCTVWNPDDLTDIALLECQRH